VLEHLPNPRETLTEIRRILRPGGKLAVSVPNFSSIQARWAKAAWFHLDLPRHLFHFPLPALRQLLEDCGFECTSEHHFSLRQNPFGWVQSWLNRRPGLPRNGLYRLLKRGNSGHAELFDRSTRFKLLAGYYLGMPFAIVGSIAAAALRCGATVCVMAKSRA
jgi:SAM-dependent methyltransferase